MAGDVVPSTFDGIVIETVSRIISPGPDAAAIECLAHTCLQSANHHRDIVEAVIDQPMHVP